MGLSTSGAPLQGGGGNVGSAQILDDSIVNADINSAAAIAGTKLADNAIGVDQLGILTTKGDILNYGTAPARVAVGTNDQVLTADSAQGAGLKWAAAGGGGAWTLVEKKTISSASTSDAFTSLAARKVFLLVINLKSANADTIIGLRLNGDTAGNYTFMSMNNPTATNNTAQDNFKLIRNDTDDVASGAIVIGGESIDGGEAVVNGIVFSEEGGTGRYAFIGGNWNKSGETDVSTITIVQTTGATGYTGTLALYYNTDIA